MNSKKLSKRLEAVASFIDQDSRLADIGSDHAYLPCHLVLNKQINFAIAGEVVAGPLASAKKEIARWELADQVQARLGDGLAVIQPEDQVDTITICGMGGALIVDILERGLADGKLQNQPKLILQPNLASDQVRSWLVEHDYKIVAEDIIQEKGKIYEVIVAQAGHHEPALSESDLLFGPYTYQANPQVFKEKWQAELAHHQKIIDQIQYGANQEGLDHFGHQLNLIQERLNEIEEAD
ncbi:hypothetical protein AWM75_02040 [Aerococcus urinaehominis]|uniref:Uncharacterized protein n=1 Tax=Aerococcus urinaehominis TaxID=128944 RepID=A0A120IAQ9_9LACT|nr:tRNA (adenine(22)-N(1))-methyltransferase TrmK [Aerococcus urinaehominis]AMB98846.1 hypothetical protein AWM75_02040 [Aerococcus urinaehominis]SDM17448.1 tRNA (adenine22-N1)-methyltransferase [Aerococcus urinaehominis]